MIAISLVSLIFFCWNIPLAIPLMIIQTRVKRKKICLLTNRIHQHELRWLQHFADYCALTVPSSSTGKLPFKETASRWRTFLGIWKWWASSCLSSFGFPQRQILIQRFIAKRLGVRSQETPVGGWRMGTSIKPEPRERPCGRLGLSLPGAV